MRRRGKKQKTEVVLQEVSAAKYVVGVHVVLYGLEHAQTHAGDSLPHPLLPQLAHWKRERERESGCMWQTVVSTSILCEWESKQGVMDVFMGGWNAGGTLLKHWEMFCMVWFMESSRLSNSLSCRCSLWRGACYALPTSLTPFLSSPRLLVSVCFHEACQFLPHFHSSYQYNFFFFPL